MCVFTVASLMNSWPAISGLLRPRDDLVSVPPTRASRSRIPASPNPVPLVAPLFPAMLFLGVVMMPFYYGSKVRSVPEFMLRRFGTARTPGERDQFALAQVLIAGVTCTAGHHRQRAARLAGSGCR